MLLEKKGVSGSGRLVLSPENNDLLLFVKVKDCILSRQGTKGSRSELEAPKPSFFFFHR